MNAIIYCRTSGKNSRSLDNDKISQAEKKDSSGKISLQLQESECKQLAEKLGFNVVGVFTDNGKSCITYPTGYEEIAKKDIKFLEVASKMKIENDFRDGLGNALNEISKGHVKALIIRNETRLMRSPILSNLLTTVYAFLEKYKVIIYTVEGRKIDASNFQDIFMTNIISMSEVNGMMEKIRNSVDSTRAKRDAGLLYGKIKTYGLRKTGKQRIEIVEEEISVMKEIYQRFLDGDSLIKIYDDLYKRGIAPIKTRRSSLGQLLKPLSITGYQTNTKGEYIPIKALEDNLDKLVPLEMWKLAQHKLQESSSRKWRTAGIIHPLTGLIYCGECGARGVIHTSSSQFVEGGVTYSYVCRSKSEKVKNCDVQTKEFAKKISMQKRIEKFSACGLNECLMPLLALAVIEDKKKKQSMHLQDGKLMLINEELERIAETRKKLVARVAKGLITDSELDEMLLEQNQRKKTLEAEKTKIEAEMLEAKTFSKKHMLELSFDMFKGDLDLNIYRELANRVFDKILLFSDSIEVFFKGKEKSLVLPKLKHTCTKVLPFGMVSLKNENEAVVVYHTQAAYKHRDTAEAKLIYDDEALKVWLV